jgi:hypothetical protein
MRDIRGSVSWLVGLLMVLCASGAASSDGDLSRDLADIEARIEYGFHTADAALIAATAPALERLSTHRAAEFRAAAAYYLGLASFRLAALDGDTARGNAAALRAQDCVRHAEQSATHRIWTVEASVLMGACLDVLAAAEPLRAPLHQRRRDRAWSRATELDARNPRLLLVQSGVLSGRGTSAVTNRRADELDAALAAAIEGFGHARRQPGDGAPAGWGEAEALARLAELRIEQRRWREARDLVEQALFIAPHYRFAQHLQERVMAAR